MKIFQIQATSYIQATVIYAENFSTKKLESMT